MKTAPLSLRLVLFLLLGFVALGPAAPALEADVPRAQPARAHSLQATNRLLDYIRGNRTRVVQIATLGLVVGLVILMTATRKH